MPNPPLPTANPLPVSPDGTYPVTPKQKKLDEAGVKKYRQLLETSAKYLEKKFHKDAMRMTDYYELIHQYEKSQEGIPGHKIKVAYPYANARQILSETYIKDPKAVVKPVKKTFQKTDAMGLPVTVDTVAGAKKLKGCIDYVVRESNLKEESKTTVLSGTVTGLGCTMMSGTKGSKIPTFEDIAFKDIVWSHAVRNIYRSSWVARRLVRPMEEIRNDPEYNEGKSRVQSATLDPKTYGEQYKDNKEEYGVLWDLYDKAADRHMVIPDGMDIDLIEGATITEKYDFKVEGGDFKCDWPFFFYVNEQKLTQAFGMGDIAPIESQVEERDFIRSAQANHVRRFNRKYLAKRKFLDSNAMFQLTDGPDGTVVEVADDITPASFQAVQDAPIAADFYNVDDSIQRDMDTIQAMGANGVARGVGDKPGTLGEAQIIDDNSQNRIDEKKDNVANYYGRMFRAVAMYVQQWWVESDELLVSGDGSKPADWLQYSPEEIQGEYSYEVDPETVRDNSAVYRKQAQESLATLTPLMQPAMGPMGPGASLLQQVPGLAVLARKYLETFDSVKAEVDMIVPEEWTHPQMQQGMPPQGGNPADDLLNQINSSDPQAFLDKLGAMPENERSAITQQIQKLRQSAQVTPGAPSGSSIQSSVTRL